MSLSIRPDALQRLYRMPLVLFVERGLERHVPPGLADAAVPFAGTVIGSGATARTLDAGLPAVPMIVLERRGGVFASELATAATAAGLPFQPHIVRVPEKGRFGLRLGDSVQRMLLKIAVGLAHRSAEIAGQREAEIGALRRQVESLQQALGRRDDALATLGYAGGEFSLPLGALASMTEAGAIVSSLEGVESIEVWPVSSGIGQIALRFTLEGSVIAEQVVIPADGARVLDLPVPVELLVRDPLLEISVQQLAPDMDAIGHQAFDAVRFRLDGPAVKQSAHIAEPLGSAAGDRQHAAFAVSGAGSNTPLVLARGVVLDPTNSVTVLGVARGSLRGDPAFVFTRHGSSDPAEGTSESTNEGGRLHLTGKVRTEGRYDVAVVADGPAVAWARPMLLRGSETPTAFASARFAALANAISFCDGPLEESAINSANGFPVITVTDGDGFMQTHPVAGRVVGARVPNLIPFGATRLWIDIENAHHLAQETEFIAVVTRHAPAIPLAQWLPQLPDYEAFSISDVDETTTIARSRLKPASAAAMRIDLLRPLPHQASLYCLVRTLGAEMSYGWCRWHRIVVGVAPAASLTD